MKRVFLDSAFLLIALGVKTDQYHQVALRLAEQFLADGTRLVTTRAVLLEIGAGLSKLKYRSQACEIFETARNDGTIELIEINRPLADAASELFCSRMDKEWSLADCVSFLVMREHAITDALTTDEHFEQAGFKALMRF